ncbi:MAG: hypothetical protein FWF46_00250 [Oscillospiraceae bacterium]|nr:hypothetical protein [Oscillospiraceae bacterium]
MENSANALLMAASVLIGIIILSIFVAVFSNAGNFAKNIEAGMSNTQIQKFNNQFEQYFTSPDDTIKKMNGHDIVSLVNLAIATNVNAGEEVINITINGSSCLGRDKNGNPGMDWASGKKPTDLLTTDSTYNPTPAYDNTGKITSINFTEIPGTY